MNHTTKITPARCEAPAKRLALPLAFALTVLFAAHTAHAQIEGWSLRLGGIGTNYEKHGGIGNGLYTSHLDLGSGFGPQAAAEFRVVPIFGVELSSARLDLDAHYRVARLVPISLNPFILGEVTEHEANGKYTLKPLAFAALFHPLPGRQLDVYLGPQVARVSFANDVGAGKREPEQAWGGKAGVEMRFGGGPWSAALEVGRLEIDHIETDHDLYGNFGLSTASVLVVFRGR
jgi:hypothetical protein